MTVSEWIEFASILALGILWTLIVVAVLVQAATLLFLSRIAREVRNRAMEERDDDGR